MERDDKRLPLGAAVMWINARRRGERGHVVEVATTHATVVREDGARLRLRWGDLLAEDRAPQRTIVTDFDRAQVRFEVGDVVVFTARGGSTMLGTVEKLNPKRARVRCAQSRWNVPYVVLRHWEAPARDRGGERLDEVAKETRALMDAHGLEEWTFVSLGPSLHSPSMFPNLLLIETSAVAEPGPRTTTTALFSPTVRHIIRRDLPLWEAIRCPRPRACSRHSEAPR